MTATKELRRLLDERGVWHEDIHDATLWVGTDGVNYTAAEIYSRGNMKPSTKRLILWYTATPEQAIAATLDVGTCHNADIGAEGYFKCSECGASCSVDWELNGWGEPNYCPNCGRRVVEVDA